MKEELKTSTGRLAKAVGAHGRVAVVIALSLCKKEKERK